MRPTGSQNIASIYNEKRATLYKGQEVMRTTELHPSDIEIAKCQNDTTRIHAISNASTLNSECIQQQQQQLNHFGQILF